MKKFELKVSTQKLFDLRKSKIKTFLKKFLQRVTLYKKVVMVSDD